MNRARYAARLTLQKLNADDVAAEVGCNKRWSEIRGRFIRVTDEDGKEIYRTPLTNCF